MRDKERGYTAAEIMVCLLARRITDRGVIHVGAFTPLVLASALVAKNLHAPNAVLFPISVSGRVVDKPYQLGLTLWEARAMHDGPTYSVVELFNHVEKDQGFDVEPIAPAQIDQFANVNNSVIGTYDRPKVRLPGGAGIENLMICKRTPVLLYTAHHTTRTFVAKVDFITGAGHLTGGNSRLEQGIPGEGGPGDIVTNLAVMRYDRTSGCIKITSTHEGVDVQEVIENTGFELRHTDPVPTTEAPTEDELRVLRTEVDPLNIRDLEFISGEARRRAVKEIADEELRRAKGGV